MHIVATPRLAYAVATDAANASKRKRCIPAWDDECLAAYAAAFERICRAGGFWVDHEDLDNPANVPALRRWNELLDAPMVQGAC
jgi:hypothetical protein